MSLGGYLRERREARGVSLEEIARTTRIAQRSLQALESDDLTLLPPAPFTKGFIRAYCAALQEPPEEALALYGAPDGRAPARERVTGARESRSRGPLLISFILLVVLGVALFAVTLALQSGRGAPQRRAAPAVDPRAAEAPARPSSIPTTTQSTGMAQTRPAETAPAASPPVVAGSPATRPPAPSATAPAPLSPASHVSGAGPSPANVPTPSSSPSPAASGAAVNTSATTPARSAEPGPYRLRARTTDATWIRVLTEDGRSSEETIPAGEVREWVSNRPFVLTIGNAGGVTLELNGRAVPPLGARGQVINRLVLPPEP